MSDWLEKGMDILIELGPSGLTIERLCKGTGKTKGSFYHHFQSIDDFRRRLLSHWQRAHTEELVEATSGEDAAEALRTLGKLTARLPYSREVAFRLWAQRDAEAAGIVAAVDEARVGHLQSLFQRQGYGIDEAREQAWFEYAFFIGMAQLGLPMEQRRRLRDRLERKMR